AQNRAAQRAFRERKERYVKSLEDRIKELEEMQPESNSVLSEENTNLKVLVQKLETENYLLKEKAFTFDFPITQPGLYNVAKTRQDSIAAQQPPSPPLTLTNSNIDSSPKSPDFNSNTKPSKSINGGDARVKPLSDDPLPWTPPSSGGDSVPNSPANNDLSPPEQDTLSQISYSDAAGVVPKYNYISPEAKAILALVDDDGNTHHNTGVLILNNNNDNSIGNSNSHIIGLKNINNTNAAVNVNEKNHDTMFYGNDFRNNQQSNGLSPASTLALFSDNSPSTTVEDIVNTPLSLFQSESVGYTPSMSVSSFSFDQTQSLFMDFRDPSDPLDYFTSFDDNVDNVFPNNSGEGMLIGPSLDYRDAAEDVISSHIEKELELDVGTTKETSSSSPPIKHDLDPLGENELAIPCPQAWEQIAKHPKFDDADMDLLCAELKSKAKCSGHGPVVSLSDVDKLWSKLDQEYK
ncbi:DNA-binding transcription factor yap1, partial [Entomortierella lignicola]